MQTKPWWKVEESSAFADDGGPGSIDLSTFTRRQIAGRARTRGEFRLVGHRECQQAIAAVCTACGRPGESGRSVVRIVRVQGRIKVTTLKGATLGFFSQQDAASYGGVIAAIAQHFETIRCGAMVEMEWDGALFVTLDLGSPADCAALAGLTAQA